MIEMSPAVKPPMSFCLQNIQSCQNIVIGQVWHEVDKDGGVRSRIERLEDRRWKQGSWVYSLIETKHIVALLSKTKCLAFTDNCRWFRNLKASVSLFVSVVKISIDIDIFRKPFAGERNNGFDIFLTPVCKCEEEVGRWQPRKRAPVQSRESEKLFFSKESVFSPA